MYVLSISSVSEVMMVLKNLFSKKIVMFFVCLPCKLVLSQMYLHISKWPYWAAKWSGVISSCIIGFMSFKFSCRSPVQIAESFYYICQLWIVNYYVKSCFCCLQDKMQMQMSKWTIFEIFFSLETPVFMFSLLRLFDKLLM